MSRGGSTRKRRSKAKRWERGYRHGKQQGCGLPQTRGTADRCREGRPTDVTVCTLILVSPEVVGEPSLVSRERRGRN